MTSICSCTFVKFIVIWQYTLISFNADVYIPKTKLSGLNIWPKGPDRTESIVPGSRSMRILRGTYLPPGITKNDGYNATNNKYFAYYFLCRVY